ncbi:MAG: winged helix DNA-binding domain-containing protein, partial [Dehalococcoidia bacterium]
ALADGPATRAEIVARLADWGMALEGQARIHLLGYAAAKEVVTYGPQRGAQSAFVLLDDWVKPKPLASREAALGELARRYLAAFGPARPHDFAVWSRLPVSDIRTGWTALESDLREVTIDGVPAWLLGDADPDDAPPVVRLLPAWDTYLLAYRDRAIDPTHAHRIGDGGILGPTVLVDGWIEGTWQIARRRSGVDISVDPFVSFDGDVTAAFEKEADDVRRFLGAPSERGATKP